MADDLNELAATQAATMVTDLWQESQLATGPFRARIIDWYKQYKGIPNRKNYEGMANVVVNETLAAVESIVAQEVRAVFSDPNFVLFLPGEPTDEVKVKLLQNAMIHYLNRMHWKSKFIQLDRTKVKYGTCFAEVSWKFAEGLKFKRDPLTGMHASIKSTLRDHPSVDYIDTLDIAMDPGKYDIEEMDWFIIRKRKNWDAIKNNERLTLYSSVQVDKIPKKNTGKNFEYLGNRQQKMQASGINYSFFSGQPYEILKYWGLVPRWWVDEKIDIQSDEANTMVSGVIEVVTPDKITLRLARNPYHHQEIPVVMAKHIGIDDEAWGMGACEIAEKLQQELNDKRNQLLDRTTEDNFPALIENRAANIGEIKKTPYYRIKSNLSGEQALSPLKTGGDFSAVVVMEQRVKEDIRHKTGATDPVQGIPSNKESTAFEFAGLKQSGSARIDVSTMDMGDTFLKRLYTLIYKLIQQYVDKDTMISIVGKSGIKWEKLTPTDVEVDADVIAKIPTDIDNRIIIRNQMIQFLAQVYPLYPRVNVAKIVRKIYDLFGFEDGEEVVPHPSSAFDRGALTTEEEMQVLLLGQKINVSLEENHSAKINALIQVMAQYESQMSQQAKDAFKDKIRQHLYYMAEIERIKGSMMSSQNGKGKKPESEGTEMTNKTEQKRSLTREATI